MCRTGGSYTQTLLLGRLSSDHSGVKMGKHFQRVNGCLMLQHCSISKEAMLARKDPHLIVMHEPPRKTDCSRWNAVDILCSAKAGGRDRYVGRAVPQYTFSHFVCDFDARQVEMLDRFGVYA